MSRLCIIVLLFSSVQFELTAQGCSDAGFCTMGAMRPNQPFDKKMPLHLRSVELTYYHGHSNVSVLIESAILDFGFTVNEKNLIQLKLPYTWTNGNFGSVNGLGDISLSATRTITRVGEFDLAGTIGAKIATGNADARHPFHGNFFPMYYQTSLGTYDFVAGASLISRKWLITAGYQQPLVHRNENKFKADSSAWSWYEGGFNYVKRNSDAVDLRRGADVMARIERSFRFSRLSFNVGWLNIYRISRDQIRNEEGNYVRVDKTRGLVSNLLIGAGYKLNVNSGLSVMYGQKLTDRKVNPDGLTRKKIITVTLSHNF